MLDLWSLCTLDYTHLVWALGNLSTARACWLWGEVGFPFPIFHDTRGEATRKGHYSRSELQSSCLAPTLPSGGNLTKSFVLGLFSV